MKDNIQKIKDAGLRVTPQRIAVLEEILKCNHPTVDILYKKLKKSHPNIAIGTVYNILESFVNAAIIKKVPTTHDVMRYDAIAEPHHHLCDIESDKIEDFIDSDLNKLIDNYFRDKNIDNFEIKGISIQLLGNFKHK